VLSVDLAQINANTIVVDKRSAKAVPPIACCATIDEISEISSERRAKRRTSADILADGADTVSRLRNYGGTASRFGRSAKIERRVLFDAPA
jgi:hypothetical protein